MNISGSLPEDWSALASRLTMLYLGDNKIVGTIPAGLAQLKALRLLVLSYNKLVGTIPPAIAGLGAVESLDVYSNSLSGIVPDLPFKQYTSFCGIQDPKTPKNKFACPLPPDVVSCKPWPPTCMQNNSTPDADFASGIDVASAN